MEDFVTTTLEGLVGSPKESHHQGDIPPPIGEKMEGDKEEFHFSDDKQSRDKKQPNDNEKLNSEGEESSESKSDEEEENKDMAEDQLDWMAQGSCSSGKSSSLS